MVFLERAGMEQGAPALNSDHRFPVWGFEPSSFADGALKRWRMRASSPDARPTGHDRLFAHRGQPLCGESRAASALVTLSITGQTRAA